MHKLSSLLPILLLVLSCCSQSARACDDTPVMTGTKEDGTKVELILNSKQVAKTPAWRPGQGEPPLSVARAIQLGSTWAKGHYKRFDSVDVERISLQSFGECSNAQTHWYYVLEFTPVMDGNRFFGSFNWAAVLFDGTVVGATETKHGSN